jgi:glycosyltransferase involved in cell wall biosynthesis
MKISLIITTYNWPEALNAVLESVKMQSMLPYEVIIADDGSTAETTSLITKNQTNFPVSLLHSWQQNKGFRAALSRNKAINKVTGEYVIIIDGDIFLPKNFVKSHALTAKSGQFIQGTRVLLNPKQSQKVLSSYKLPSPLSVGINNRHNTIYNTYLSALCSNFFNHCYKAKSCNMSFWLDDIKKVNGFNNDFIEWGYEDNEVHQRLLNIKLKGLYMRFLGSGYHLYHPECSREQLNTNKNLLQKTIAEKLTFCQNGLTQAATID